MTRRFKILLLSTLLAVSGTQAAFSKDWQFDDIGRIVAITDVHGNRVGMVATLRQAGILGDDLTWAGGQAHLVVLGDFLDRGPDSRAVMDLLMRLEAEADAAGGHVHVLIGNHESMLLTGDMRYVSDAEYAAFAADEDDDERAQWFALYAKHGGGAEQRSRFDADYPRGYFAMRRAFRAAGYYGQWLLQKNVIVVINGTAFVHGGLSPRTARTGIAGVNRDLQKELVEYVKALGVLTDAEILLPTDSHYDYVSILNNYLPALKEDREVLQALAAGKRLGGSALLDSDGPLWYRGNATCPGIVERFRLEAALITLGLDRVVVGHTPTPTRQVLQRFDGRLIEIDTGMLSAYYKGSGNALVLEADVVSVINQSGLAVTVPKDHPRHVGRRPGNLSPSQLQILLQYGDVAEIEHSDSTAWLKISDGEHTVRAVFSKRRGKGVYPEVAAYRMDRLLQLDMVPVTVIREIDGSDGSVQFMPGNPTNEVERSASGSGSGAACPIADQWAAMSIFDVLISNEGRTQRRMSYDQSWRLILSGHDRAFTGKKGRPRHLKSAVLSFSPGWRRALEGLTDALLAEQFGDVLDKRRLRALLARRDELLATSE